MPSSKPDALVLAALSLLVAGPAAALDLAKERLPTTQEACPEKGTGFVRVPGSRSCIRLSGRAAAGLDLRAGTAPTGAAPAVMGRIAIDNRVDSDLGEVRTYVRVGNGRR